MKVSKDQFSKAAHDLEIPDEKVKALWQSLERSEEQESPLSKMLYYFGAMIVISAMTWFMTIGWMVFGGGGIFIISLLYAAAFVFAGAKLWNNENMQIPAGLLITMAVCMTPLAIYGLQSYFGMFPEGEAPQYRSFYETVKSSWLGMEIGTILAGLVALKFYPFPFITAPIFFAAWFMSMDIIPLITGDKATVEQAEWISLTFGLILLSISYLLDLKKKPQFAFWGYFFGTLSFWGALTALCFDKGELVLFFYFLVNISMMIKSVLLKRKVLLVFGAIGAFSYLGYLSYHVFEDSILFPFALTLLGLAVIYLGVLYQRNSKWIEMTLVGFVPKRLRAFLPFDDA